MCVLKRPRIRCRSLQGWHYPRGRAQKTVDTPSGPGVSNRSTLFGQWRSLVAHLHGVQVVAGSNPVGPTIKSLGTSVPGLLCFVVRDGA